VTLAIKNPVINALGPEIFAKRQDKASKDTFFSTHLIF
jgi:hypothetical protein